MIRNVTVAICDVCGFTEQALIDSNPDIPNKYKLPEGWGTGHSEEIHICPNCKRKLDIKLRAKRNVGSEQ